MTKAAETLGIVVNDTKEGCNELTDIREVCEVAPGHRSDVQQQGLADWLYKYLVWPTELYGGEIPFQALYETAAFGEYKRYLAGEAIFTQNDMDEKMYIIIAGCVCFVCDAMQVHVLGAGHPFGEFECSRVVDEKIQIAPAADAGPATSRKNIYRRLTTAVAGPQRQTTEVIAIPLETYERYLKPLLDEVDDTLFAYERAVSSFRRGIRFDIRWKNVVGTTQWNLCETRSLWSHVRVHVFSIIFLLRVDRLWFEKSGRRLWKHIHGEMESGLLTAARKQMKRHERASGKAIAGPKVGRAAAVRCRWILTGTSLKERPQVKEDHALARGMMLLQLIPFIDVKSMEPDIAQTTAIDLYQCMICKDYEVDEVVFSEGSKLDNIYVVMQGECDVISKEGVRTLFPGDVCGMEDIQEIKGASSFKRHCTARARTLLSLAVVPQKVYLRHADSQAKQQQREKVTFVQSHPFFHGLPVPWQVSLASRMESKELELNDVLVKPGDAVEDVYFLITGQLKSVKHEHAIPKDVDKAATAIQRRIIARRLENMTTTKETPSKKTVAATMEKLQAKILDFEHGGTSHRQKTSAALLRRYGPSDAVGVDEIVKKQATYDAKVVCTSTACTMLVLPKEDYQECIVQGPHTQCFANMKNMANQYEHSSKGRMMSRKMSVQARMVPGESAPANSWMSGVTEAAKTHGASKSHSAVNKTPASKSKQVVTGFMENALLSRPQPPQSNRLQPLVAIAMSSIRVRKPRTLRQAVSSKKNASTAAKPTDILSSKFTPITPNQTDVSPAKVYTFKKTVLGRGNNTMPKKAKAAAQKANKNSEKKSHLTPLTNVFPNLKKVASDAIDAGDVSVIARLSANSKGHSQLGGTIGGVLPHGMFKHESCKQVEIRTQLSPRTSSLFAYTPKAPGRGRHTKKKKQKQRKIVRPQTSQAAFALPDWMTEDF